VNEQPIACNLGALTGRERERRSNLFAGLSGGADRIEELPGGYSIRFPPGRTSWSTLAELVGLERRCCPFLRFTLTLDEDGRIELAIGGREGVKAFLSAELGIDPAG
jgi:hypothetical protein